MGVFFISYLYMGGIIKLTTSVAIPAANPIEFVDDMFYSYS
jgi:hypothetical protein